MDKLEEGRRSAGYRTSWLPSQRTPRTCPPSNEDVRVRVVHVHAKTAPNGWDHPAFLGTTRMDSSLCFRSFRHTCVGYQNRTPGLGEDTVRLVHPGFTYLIYGESRSGPLSHVRPENAVSSPDISCASILLCSGGWTRIKPLRPLLGNVTQDGISWPRASLGVAIRSSSVYSCHHRHCVPNLGCWPCGNSFSTMPTGFIRTTLVLLPAFYWVIITALVYPSFCTYDYFCR